MHMLTIPKKVILLLCLIPFLCFLKAIHFRLVSIGPFDIAYVRSQNLNQTGQHAAMLKAYMRLMNKYPARTELLYPLGWAYYKNGDPVKAYECMRAYKRANPYYPQWQDQYMEQIRKAALDVH